MGTQRFRVLSQMLIVSIIVLASVGITAFTEKLFPIQKMLSSTEAMTLEVFPPFFYYFFAPLEAQ
jgi:hypothetical protein